MKLAVVVLVASLFVPLPGSAATSPDEILSDTQLEQRARALGKELRCLVCQNQSIDDSDAELAQDLRRIVRERLEAGDSDNEIKDFLVQRYGEFVLLKPPIQASTYLLWTGPFVVLALGAGLVWRVHRRARARDGGTAEIEELSNEERARLKSLLGNDGSATG